MFTIELPKRFFGSKDEERAQHTLSDPGEELIDIFAEGSRLSSGVRVNNHTALNFVAVYAAQRILSESVASLPFHLYKTDENGRTRLSSRDDSRAGLIDDAPNAEMTAMELWEHVMFSLTSWGNAYIYREIHAGNGLTTALWPLFPDQTQPFRTKEGTKWYVTRTPTGEERLIDPNNMIHVKAFGMGDVGISPIGRAKQAIGIGLAADSYAANFFGNDARPGGIIKYAGSPSDEKFEALLSKWKKSHQGLDNSHLVGILTGGGEWQDVAPPGEDVEFVSSRQFQIEEIARLYRVPLHMLQSAKPGAVGYSSVQQFSRDFVDFSLRPWLVRIEQQVKRGVFSSSVDKGLGVYPEFKVDGLLRGDTKERYEAYELALKNGWMSRNEVRQLENLPREDGLDDFTGYVQLQQQQQDVAEGSIDAESNGAGPQDRVPEPAVTGD